MDQLKKFSILIIFFSHLPKNVREELRNRFEGNLIFKHVKNIEEEREILSSDEVDKIIFFGKNFRTETIILIQELLNNSSKKLGYLKYLNSDLVWFKEEEATKELIKEFIERSKIFIRVKTKHNELRLESTFNKLLNKDDELAFFFVKQYAKPVIEFIMNNRFIDVEIDDNIKLKFKDNMNNNIYINIIKSMSLKKFLKTYKNNNKKDDSNSFKPLYNFLIDILLKLHIDTNTTKDMLKQMIVYKILSDYSTDEICKLYGSDILYLNNAGSSECNFEKLIFAIEFFINELSSIS